MSEKNKSGGEAKKIYIYSARMQIFGYRETGV